MKSTVRKTKPVSAEAIAREAERGSGSGFQLLRGFGAPGWGGSSTSTPICFGGGAPRRLPPAAG